MRLGASTEAAYEPPVLKGRLNEGGRQFLAGLKLRNSIDVENLCSCRDSRVRGIICAHSLAVGLQVIKPAQSAGSSSRPDGTKMTSSPRQQTGETPRVELTLEGSLRHLEAEIRFHYEQPNVANSAEGKPKRWPGSWNADSRRTGARRFSVARML